jgi:hypothetical protein
MLAPSSTQKFMSYLIGIFFLLKLDFETNKRKDGLLSSAGKRQWLVGDFWPLVLFRVSYS